MSVGKDDPRLLAALCEQLDQLVGDEGLAPEDEVRLLAALLHDAIARARAAGLDDAALESAREAGEALMVEVQGQEELAPEELAPEELVPEEPEAAPAEEALAGLRRYPRFVSRNAVSVSFAERADLKEMWTRDISCGGLFVHSDDPPAMDSMLTISLETPDGQLELHGRVVHVMDAEMAAATGRESGVGIQFSDLTHQRREALERYLEGLSDTLGEAPSAAVEEQDDGVDATAKRFIRLIEATELYQALGLEPEAEPGAIAVRLAELEDAFSPDDDRGTAAQRTRLQSAARVLERVSTVLRDPTRRLVYDFGKGHVRAEQRIAECEAGGRDLRELRSAWARVFAERIREAQLIAERAATQVELNKHEKAHREVMAAVELDPFNSTLRTAAERWEVLATVQRECREGKVDARSRIAWAAERGVGAAQLRKLWCDEQSERFALASQHGARALQAESVKLFSNAIEEATLAMEHDPFNQELSAAIEGWRSQAEESE